MSDDISFFKFYVLWIFFFSMYSSLQAQSAGSKTLSMHNFIRCTRRFTPGMCMDPVKPVWTFLFQIQNCTERYGCPTELRSNRFSTYNRCLRRCKPLMNLYNEILAQNTQNLTEYLRFKSLASSGRRDIDVDEELEIEEDQLPVITGIEAPAPNPLEDDSDYTFKGLTLDIDYIDDGIGKDDLIDHL